MQDNFDAKRRLLVHMLGGTAALGVAGCCSRAFVPPIPDLLKSRSLASPVLVPMTDMAPKMAAQPVIDVHGHFFNGSDASVAEYLTLSFGHMAPEYQDLLRRLQPVVQRLICLAPTAAEEYRDLASLAQAMEGRSVVDIRAVLRAQMTQRSRDTAEELWNEIRKQEGLEAAFRNLLAREQNKSLAFDRYFVQQAIDPFTDADKSSALPDLEVSAAGLLNFVFCMLRPRWHNVQQYRSRYEPEGVIAVAGAMVDFDGWYQPPAISPPEDQMKLHALLARMSSGYILPLISFNPWADDSRSNLGLVERAIRDYGFAGVKLYPPMGFWAADNRSLPSYPGRRPPSLAELDRRLEKLFAFCAAYDVPVLAHANSSMGPNHGADNYSGPLGWSRLVDRYANSAAPPKIILGHFGGGAPEAPQTIDAPWPAKYAALMNRSGGAQVYGDIGMWTELAGCTAGCTAVRRLEQAKQASAMLPRRLMYGSDWFMLVKQKGWWKFPEVARSALGGTFDLDLLMFRNAVECFGLGPGSKTHQRIREHVGRAPVWQGAVAR